jgi:hypothetical protein
VTPEDRAWQLAGDLLLEDTREGDAWMMAREELAAEILKNIIDGKPPLVGVVVEVGQVS